MPDDLVAPEGVDEGSATPEPTTPTDPVGPPATPPPAGADPPVPPGTEPSGPGQQLEEGEG
jgi:hypothetical protein